MYQDNYAALDVERLVADIHFERYADQASVLIQIFCGTTIDDLGRCGALISERLPVAVIIGATTDGEIHDARVTTGIIVASFSVFERTRLRIASAESADDRANGKDIAARLVHDEPARLIILLSDGTHTHGERLLEGVAHVSRAPVAGGMAGDNATFTQTAVLHGDKLIKRGAVGVALIGDALSLRTDHAFSWLPIGKEFLVTRAEGNRVYTIGNLASIEFYQKYLGRDVADHLPVTGIEYPLIMRRNGMIIARACIQRFDDGSLAFAGDVHVGTKVAISCGDPGHVREESARHSGRFRDCEALFIYACMARRRFLGTQTQDALTRSLRQSNAGFFTYGEFFTSGGENHLLNETLTLVGLSESEARKPPASRDDAPETIHPPPAEAPSAARALSHYARVISEEMGRIIPLLNQAGQVFSEWTCRNETWIPIYLSEAFGTLTGHPPEAFILDGRSLLSLIHPEDHAVLNRIGRKAMQRIDTVLDADFRVVHREGHILHVHAHLYSVRPPHVEQAPVLVVVLRDVTAQHELAREKELASYRASHDMLTNLYNRAHLEEHLNASVKRLRDGHDSYGALFFIDLDHFKQINDTKGHQVGDQVLIETALRIRRDIRAEDVPCRLGGDEFVILAPHMADTLKEAALNAEHMAGKLLELIKAPYSLPPYEFRLSGSVGITLFNGEETPDTLLRYADSAMYQAKESGRNAYRFFDLDLQKSMEARIDLQQRLRHALETGRFKLAYQYRVRIDQDRRIVGVEALLRWHDEELGVVPPSIFIPVAESSGMIIPLNYWILRQAARQISVWRHDPEKSAWYISVNISARQFQQLDFVERVESIAAEEGAPPEKIRLELTESLLVAGGHDPMTKIKALNAAGFTFSIDDFGTGYSSLAHLKILPVHELKIDRSFVRDIAADPNDRIIVATIISITRQFGLDVIAEGVETQEQVDMLMKLGCFLFQGYFFGRPMDADTL